MDRNHKQEEPWEQRGEVIVKKQRGKKNGQVQLSLKATCGEAQYSKDSFSFGLWVMGYACMVICSLGGAEIHIQWLKYEFAHMPHINESFFLWKIQAHRQIKYIYVKVFGVDIKYFVILCVYLFHFSGIECHWNSLVSVILVIRSVQCVIRISEKSFLCQYTSSHQGSFVADVSSFTSHCVVL